MNYLLSLIKFYSEIKDMALSIASREDGNLEEFDPYNDLLILEATVKSLLKSSLISEEDYMNFVNACNKKKYSMKRLKNVLELVLLKNPQFNSIAVLME
jgi:F0F1-type ATP synthase delta subunit